MGAEPHEETEAAMTSVSWFYSSPHGETVSMIKQETEVQSRLPFFRVVLEIYRLIISLLENLEDKKIILNFAARNKKNRAYGAKDWR